MGLRTKINSNVHIKRVLENSLSLTVLTFINYGFPIFLIPYLTRKLGVEQYGLYAFALAVANYFTLFVRFGFEFSATKELSQIRGDENLVNALFSRVTTVRFLLMSISVLVMLVLVRIIPTLHNDKVAILAGMGVFIGNGLVPVWLFQGMENMKLMTIANFITRICSTVLIVLMVKVPEDSSLAVGIQSIGFLVGGIFSMIIAFRVFKLRYSIPTWQDVCLQVKSSWHLFLSNVGINFYRESNVIILGFFTDYQFVGYYAAAEKIIKAVQSLLSPVTQALFPYFGRRLGEKPDDLKDFFRVGKWYGLILSLIAIIFAILSPWFISLALGPDYANSITNIQVMSGVLVFGGLNYYFGIVGLVNLNLEKKFTRNVWVVGFLSIILSCVLVREYQDLGAAITMTLIEVLLFLSIVRVFRKTIKTN